MSRVATDLLREREYLVAEISDTKMYRPISIDAPVYGPSDDVEMMLSITDFPAPISGSEVKELGNAIKEIADSTTRELAKK
jgi:hypothetical protein